MLAYESFLPEEDLLHLRYKVLLILGQHHLEDNKECLVPRATLKLKKHVPPDVGIPSEAQGLMWVGWASCKHCV